jgi:hypothetical protein
MTRDRALCRLGIHRFFPRSRKYAGRRFCVRPGCYETRGPRQPQRLTDWHLAVAALTGTLAGIVATTALFLIAG